MQIVPVKTKKEKKIFKTFRKNLYKNDPYYVSTVEFTMNMLIAEIILKLRNFIFLNR